MMTDGEERRRQEERGGPITGGYRRWAHTLVEIFTGV
jgi:hypothetical protein